MLQSARLQSFVSPNFMKDMGVRRYSQRRETLGMPCNIYSCSVTFFHCFLFPVILCIPDSGRNWSYTEQGDVPTFLAQILVHLLRKLLEETVEDRHLKRRNGVHNLFQTDRNLPHFRQSAGDPPLFAAKRCSCAVPAAAGGKVVKIGRAHV